MKSKFIFLGTLAAFFSPFTGMAAEMKVESSSIACKEWAKGKILASDAKSEGSAPAASSGPVKKSGNAS